MVLYHMTQRDLSSLDEFFSTSYGKTFSASDKKNIRKQYLEQSCYLSIIDAVDRVIKDPYWTFYRATSKHAYCFRDNIELTYPLYVEHGIRQCQTWLKMANTIKADPINFFKYVVIHQHLYAEKLDFIFLKKSAEQLACPIEQLFKPRASLEGKTYFTIEQLHIDHINALCGRDYLPTLMHGNPYRNAKFYAWLTKYTRTDAFSMFIHNVDNMRELFLRIMEHTLRKERYIDVLFRDILLKNRDDVYRLMQPMPLLTNMMAMHPLFEYREHNIRDLFFNPEVSNYVRKTTVYVPDIPSFEQYRTYFLEEAEGMLYTPETPEEEFELFF